MGKPRQKRIYTPELLESLRFRFEETPQPVRAIAATVPMGRTTLYALAAESGWTRYVPPPLDLTPAARLAAEAGRLAEEARTALPPPERGRPPSEARRVGVIADGAQATPTRPPSLIASAGDLPLSGGGEEELAASTGGGEQDADFSNLEPQERRARLSAMARAIDHQLALLRQRQALPQTEHERKEISIELTKLNAALSQTEHDLQDLDRGHTVKSAIDDDGFPRDIDEARDELARRIDALVDEWLHEADAHGAPGVAGEAGA